MKIKESCLLYTRMAPLTNTAIVTEVFKNVNVQMQFVCIVCLLTLLQNFMFDLYITFLS